MPTRLHLRTQQVRGAGGGAAAGQQRWWAGEGLLHIRGSVPGPTTHSETHKSVLLSFKIRKRRNKVLKLAKGYYGSKSKLFKTAKQAVMKSGQYAYIGRKQKKRDFRKLWITRISAACKLNGMNYSTFINGLTKAGVELNRKMLSEIAISDPEAFTALTEQAKAALK